MLFKRWQLMEISLVAVPCNPEALVVERSLARMPAKSGRVLSQANQDHLDAMAESLEQISSAHRRMGRHIANASQHAQAIFANAAGPEADPFEPGNDDDDADAELAFYFGNAKAERERRLRLVQLYALAESPIGAEEEAAALRRRMVEVMSLSCSA